MNGPLAIINVNVVLTDEVLEHSAVLVSDGRIERVDELNAVSGSDLVLDGRDELYLIPGLIDTHNDGLEKEINPRPRVNLPLSLALRNYEERSMASGVTTSFHAISFANLVREERTVEGAMARCAAIRDWAGRGAIDHEILHRCDIWSPEYLEPLLNSLRQCTVPAMSLNDHTPGQGQFRDVEAMKERWRLAHADDPSYDADAEMRDRIEARKGDTTTVPTVLAAVRAAYAEKPFVITSHDDDTTEKVDAMLEVGATIAEFPVTIEAARYARANEMTITVGAPNIVRGGSASGNQDATELAREGLVDIICADYHSPSMLVAALKLVDLGICTLPQAISMVTDAPARAFGLIDRGRIQSGLRADLALVAITDGEPFVEAVIQRGEVVYQRRPLSLAARRPALAAS